MADSPVFGSSVIVCASCAGSGARGRRACSICHRYVAGVFERGKLYYWGYPLTRYFLALERARQWLNRFRFFTVLIIGLNFFVWAAVISWRAGLFSLLWRGLPGFDLFIQSAPKSVTLLFWQGILFCLYAWYRSAREHEAPSPVESYNYGALPPGDTGAAGIDPAANTWESVAALPRKSKINIARAFTKEARAAVGRAYQLADRHGDRVVTSVHIFYALLSFNRVSNIFVRLGLSVKDLQQQLAPLFTREKRPTSPVLAAQMGADAWQVLFASYGRAYDARQRYVSVTELLEVSLNASAGLSDLLFDLNIDKQKLTNVVAWARIRERLHREYVQFRGAARHRAKSGIDRAMTAVATPYLNQFSEDLTLLSQLGHTSPCVARDSEIDEVFRVVQGGVENVLLVGDYGVGKKSILEGIAEKMVGGDVPPRLSDKRLVRLSVSSLLAGATPAEAIERLLRIFHEIARARNIILGVHNLHELVGVAAGGETGKSLDMASALAEQLSGGAFLTLATTTTENYAQAIVSSSLSNVFTKVEVKEMDENQAIQVLESKVGHAEYKQQVFFSYAAIEKAVQLARRYLHETTLPGSALEIMSEAAAYARNHKGVNALVTGAEVAAVVAEKTHVPVTAVTADESTKLLHLESALHQRVVGQDEAVVLVANALRRARAELRATTRPIANFLFLGPTGVGKTELAKTIAAVYFGGEERMVRLDMSEYQDTASVYRLIGAPGAKGTGSLTEAIRRRPFSLVLLDEIEKADADVLNIFLQVMDDGRLTDSTGRVVDFTNIILIATSNAGTSFVTEQIKQGQKIDTIKDRLLHGELGSYFRPEFLNRFDGIVLFKPLTVIDIKQVAGFMLERVRRELDAKGIIFEVTPEALDFLARVGFDPEFGARPLRREVQERVENKLAELVLSGRLKRRDTVLLGADGGLIVPSV